jgi:hypothetical protein
MAALGAFVDERQPAALRGIDDRVVGVVLGAEQFRTGGMGVGAEYRDQHLDEARLAGPLSAVEHG